MLGSALPFNLFRSMSPSNVLDASKREPDRSTFVLGDCCRRSLGLLLWKEGDPIAKALTPPAGGISRVPSVDPNMPPEEGAARMVLFCSDDFSNALRRASTSSRFILTAAAFSAFRKIETVGDGNARRWVQTAICTAG